MWTPITAIELLAEIQKTETDLKGELWEFWQLIKIEPEKWIEPKYGELGGGFWVVAIYRNQVIWYNDIEEGFNVSTYKKYGHINGYYCNQDGLSYAVIRVFNSIKSGGKVTMHRAPPTKLT